LRCLTLKRGALKMDNATLPFSRRTWEGEAICSD
jgi:hypothetical protein